MIRGFVFHLIVFLFNLSCIYSQNLIPNPGFEEKEKNLAKYWNQPEDKFNHYQCYISPINSPNAGECYNGICFRNYAVMANEYLNVKLVHPLEKGKKYIIKMHIHISREQCQNAWAIDTISCLFTYKTPVTVHGYLSATPQVYLQIAEPVVEKRFEWMLIEQRFIANGTEEYLTIGNFPTVDEYANLKTKKKAIINSRPTHQPNRKKKNTKPLPVAQMIYHDQPVGISYHVRCFFDDLYLGVDSTYTPVISEITDTIKPKQFIPLNIYFETAKATLLNSSFQELDKMVEYLNKNSNYKVVIHGHTDNQGNLMSNQKLSEERAKAVVDYFTSKNILITRLSYKGWGSLSPINSNETPEGRERNRRVEMEVISSE